MLICADLFDNHPFCHTRKQFDGGGEFANDHTQFWRFSTRRQCL